MERRAAFGLVDRIPVEQPRDPRVERGIARQILQQRKGSVSDPVAGVVQKQRPGLQRKPLEAPRFLLEQVAHPGPGQGLVMGGEGGPGGGANEVGHVWSLG